ncbi:MAG: precorrin-6Y C5,15-methyltransferase (decarboxylating) subunit CbiT [Tissierellia bacterium]|nr:precorrin-6Y C5,15-methyltransferase (decarboxylating) subunit CbiT [Tissierellia bacterium]
MKILRDEDLIRGNIPMTKFKIRALSFFELGIQEGDRFLDIGCGTGSISVQAGLFGADVTSIDREREAVSLTRKNAEAQGLKIDVIEGTAHFDLPDKTFNKCFIGGGSKNMEGIFDYLEDHLELGGTLVGNFILVSSLNSFLSCLKERAYEEISASLVQTAGMRESGLFIGDNPIYVVSSRKGGK